MSNSTISHRRDCRTYRDLLNLKPWCGAGTCCACHQWGRETWRLSTRASICRECIDRKGDAVLGSVLKAERRARRWIKHHPNTRENPKWLAQLTGVSVAFIDAEIARVNAAEAAGTNRATAAP